MDKLLETLFELIPFAQLFEAWGLSQATSVALAGVCNAALVVVLSLFVKFLLEHSKNSKASRDLAPYFDAPKVKNARTLYIPTQFQNQSPTHEEEPQFSHKFVSKSLLIPFFMEIGFNEKKESDKFYLVLADSGMGKTTFMLNLYMQYTSFFNFRRKYKIRLYPFGDERILAQIKKIDPKEARDTILLLDAFDEDKGIQADLDGIPADERFRRRLDEIIEVVRDFREVVITSRTQYFPGQEDQPYELKIPRFDEKGFHTLAKFYLSPFDSQEIARYLRKKYGVFKIWNRKKKQKAAAIVERSPKLMVRPMLLNYIDYLVDSEQAFKTTYQIYETLVEKWLDREATKRKHRTVDREKFKGDLLQYSQWVALEIYRQRAETAGLYLQKEAALAVAHTHSLDLQDYEITGQSLLTRDAAGNWKFAHKSILEYFLAKEALANPRFYKELDFSGMDVAWQFYREIMQERLGPGYVFIQGGRFLMGSPESEVDRGNDETQHSVLVDDFYMAKHTVTVAQFEAFIATSNYKTDADTGGGSYVWSGSSWDKKAGVNWRCDVNGKVQTDKQHPVLHVSWNDSNAYCQWHSQKLAGRGTFRLPTEAEWEYACRAGTPTPFNTGENLTTAQANYDGNYPYNNHPKGKSLKNTTPVGSYPPNAWGLYDMHGNVYEWCQDRYGADYYEVCQAEGTVENPPGPADGSYRVLRGGYWYSLARNCRSAYRDCYAPSSRLSYVGFRLVFVP